MPAVTLPSQFFDSLPSDNSAAFEQLAALVTADDVLKESEWIDYKSGIDATPNITFSKALSGFANSGGGILIWGINTREENRHDVPSSLGLVDNPSQLEGKLKTWLASVVDPPVLNVKLRAIANAEGKGFVVVFIPESGLKPHQSLAQGVKHLFYIRAGHQHQPASQALLRQLFQPHTKPVLKLRATVTGTVNEIHNIECKIVNRGEVTAQDLYIIARHTGGFSYLHLGSVMKRLSDETPHGMSQTEVQMEPLVKLHPSLSMELFKAGALLDQEFEIYVFGPHMSPLLWKVSPRIVGDRFEAFVEGPL